MATRVSFTNSGSMPSYLQEEKKKDVVKEIHFDSEDGTSWEVDDRAIPLVNVFTMGWMEDGRLGYVPDRSDYIQASPRPMYSLSEDNEKFEKYVCKSLSAGSRHTLLLMISCNPKRRLKPNPDEDYFEATRKVEAPLRKLKITGQNQLGLCEDPPFMRPVDVDLLSDEEPMEIKAGSGNCFVLTTNRDVYSWGHGRFGALGHGDASTSQVPRLIRGLQKEKVKQISTGSHHVIAISMAGKGFAWGKNHVGQLGIGHESPMQLTPELVLLNRGEFILEVSCGVDHTIAMMKTIGLDSVEKVTVFSWGDGSRGQLGSGDVQFRFRPQENRWITRYLSKHRIGISSICAGGYHNLIVTKTAVSVSGQIIAWGAGDYGQLGTGFLWDEPHPQLLNGIDHVVQVSAGLRHSVALLSRNEVMEVMAWGYNGYGELGLGDTDMRIIPTTVSALSNARALEVSCGDRHTAVRTSHRPVLACESPLYRPFYQIIEEHKPTKALVKNIKLAMTRKGLEPGLLDTPHKPLPEQAGATPDTLRSERFERGLRYCMDTSQEPPDWRRNAYETCFKCPTPKGTLQSVCLACARECKFMHQLVPWIRKRSKGNNKCDCRNYGVCVCRWSPIRAAFDFVANVSDGCIGPNQARDLLQQLRAPAPLARDELIECLTSLAEGEENCSEPRIKPVPFEEWYRMFFDEMEDAPVEVDIEEQGGEAEEFA